MTFTEVPMRMLVATAFELREPDEISWPDGVRDWATNIFTGKRYEIVATVPPDTTKGEANEMLKNLLVERFGLVYHIEQRRVDAYRLTVAKGGPKLTPAAEADGAEWKRPPGTRQPVDDKGFPAYQPGYPNIGAMSQTGVCRLAGRMVNPKDLIENLRLELRVPVLDDETGLSGKFDVKLEYACASTRSSDAASEPAPDLFTALEKQLGLKLEKTKVPGNLIVIDHLNQEPTPN
jgi:uncharacterized protein (TIGR03435 family)